MKNPRAMCPRVFHERRQRRWMPRLREGMTVNGVATYTAVMPREGEGFAQVEFSRNERESDDEQYRIKS